MIFSFRKSTSERTARTSLPRRAGSQRRPTPIPRDARVLDVAQADFVMIGKEPILEMKTVNQFFGGATAEQARAVAGKRDPVESFFEWDIGYDRFGHQIHHHDSVMAVSRMQDRSETALGMHGNIDGEIAQFDLSSRRA